MPIYEYRCSACGHELESLQKLSDAPLVTCPACRADTLVKLMSAGGFQLKGSGWYATDFKGGAKKPGTDATPAADAKTADASTADAKANESKAADSKPTETKPATAVAASPAATPAATPAAGSGGGGSGS